MTMTEATGSAAPARRATPIEAAAPYTVPQPPAAIDAAIWPSIATVPSGLKARVAGRVADAIFKAAVRRLPLEVRYPDGTVLRQGAPHPGTAYPVMTMNRPGGVRRPARRRRTDRPGRVLHGRGLGRRRPHRRHGGLRRPRRDAGARAAAEAARALPAAPAAEGTQHRAEHPLQHLPALRPLQRALRHVPGRDHDLLQRAVPGIRRGAAGRRLGRTGRRAAGQDRPAAGQGRRRGGHPGAGNRHRLGRAGPAGRRRAAPPSTPSPSPASSRSWPASASPTPATPTPSPSSSRTTARWRASTTPSSPSR